MEPRISSANSAPRGSVRPVAKAINIAFIFPPPPALIGAATAIPSGILCSPIAIIKTTPYCADSSTATPIAKPSGKL